jgi:hypothetical protein
MRTCISLIAGISVAALAPVCAAYEVDTHALVTQQAYQQSQLSASAIAQRLGWDRFRAAEPFTPPPSIPSPGYTERSYFDLTPSLWAQTGQSGYFDRETQPYEQNQMPAPYRSGPNNPIATPPFDLLGWLMRGAIREDDLPPESYRDEIPPDGDPYGSTYRVYHHFYDPIGDRALSLPLGVSCSLLPYSTGPCVRATDWAMGAIGISQLGASTPPPADPNRRNHFSWADAREAMWCGLTYRRSNVSPQRDAATRRLCWATTLNALGHVLHLIQDSAQPQHVRNDRHNPPDEEGLSGVLGSPGATNMATRTYEIFVNWRATGDEISSGLAERHIFRQMFAKQSEGPTPLVLSNGYPIPRFAQPADYLTSRARTHDNSVAAVNSRRGMADFTNRNFFSRNTLFSSDYPLPAPNRADAGWAIEEAVIPHASGFGEVREREFRWLPTDAVAPAFVDPALAATERRIPLAHDSLWSSFAEQTLSYFRGVPLGAYRTQADVLVPRAVAYSAGMIDFFFRGALTVQEPQAAVLATLDQGTPHTMDADGYPRRNDDNSLFGFTALRLRVKNTTPAIAESGTGRSVVQRASSGKVVAVARYHRNLCYRPDMTGELTLVRPGNATLVPSGCAPSNLRTNYEEQALSKPISIASELDQAQPTGFVFDFSDDPIPANVTDLRVHVVYRGVLGEERDGIAVGQLDLPEPFWVAVLNMADYYASGGQWIPTNPNGPPEDQPPNGKMLSSSWRDAHGNAASANTLFQIDGQLRWGRFVRAGVIGRVGVGQLVTLFRFVDYPPRIPPFDDTPLQIESIPFSMSRTRQYPAEVAPLGQYAPTPLVSDRGIGADALHLFYLSRDGTIGPDFWALPRVSPLTAVSDLVILTPLPSPLVPVSSSATSMTVDSRTPAPAD